MVVGLLHSLPPKWFAIVSWVLLVLIPSFIGFFLFGFYGASWGVVGLIGVGLSLEYFLRDPLKKTMLLVRNPLLVDEKGEAQIRVLLSGLNFVYPWEETDEDSSFSLKHIKIPLIQNYPTTDDEICVDALITIAPDPKPDHTNPAGYFVASEIVLDRVKATVNSFVSSVMSAIDTEMARNTAPDIGKRVTDYFAKGAIATPEQVSGTDRVTELEKACGIVFNEIVIQHIDYTAERKKARATKTTTRILKEAVDESRRQTEDEVVAGIEPVSADKAWGNAMALHGAAEKKIIEFEGDSALAAFGRGIADIFLKKDKTKTKPDAESPT